MTILILDTALPLSYGTPRQRASAARRALFARDGVVRHLTIDIHGSEFASRYQRKVDDYFVGPVREDTAQAAAAFARGTDMPASWLTPRRRKHLRAVLTRHKPSALVICDPLLSPLVPILSMLDCPVHCFDDGADLWHERAALRQPTSSNASAHRRRAELIQQGAAEIALLNPISVLQTPGLAFDQDEAFFAKTPAILCLACGYAASDARSIDALVQAAATLRAGSRTEFDVMVMGFLTDQSARIPDVRVFDDFVHVAGMSGAARCVLVPWITPELALIVQEILLVGTPVITFSTERLPQRLAGAEGLLQIKPSALSRTIEYMLDERLIGEDDWRALAASEERRLSALADDTATSPAGTSPAATAPLRLPIGPRRAMRVRPLIERPEVIYNPLSRMLLVRLRWRAGTGVEEVRLFDAAQVELNRLMPNAREKQQNPVAIEGGVVIDREALGGGVTVQLHDLDHVLEEYTIPVEDFVLLEAELAWISHDESQVNGAFWISNAADASRFALASGDFKFDADTASRVEMPETGGAAIPFSIPFAFQAKQTLSLFRWDDGALGRFQLAEQRPLLLSPTLVRQERRDDPQFEALRDKHVGRRAWVIGNGPSVRHDDLAAIPKDDITFCFNRFYLSYDSHPLREDYVVSADALMIPDFGQEMIDLSTGTPLFCTMPATTAGLRGDFVAVPPYGGYLPLFSMDPQAWVAIGGSSVYVALQMAHFMGLRTVVLYGLDYSFSMKLKRDPRFAFPVSFDEGNHFIPSYRSAKPWCPPTWRDISAGFLNARIAFESTGGRIVNATRGGKLEIFPRVDFDSLTA